VHTPRFETVAPREYSGSGICFKPIGRFPRIRRSEQMDKEESQIDEGIEFLDAESKKREKLTPGYLKKLSADLQFGSSEGDRDR
jgi:hypothetical protein